MPDVRPVIALTNVNVEKMSRHELLEWVNSTVNGQYKKVEELCSGVAYCLMVEMLFPKSIGLKKIKTSAKLDLEFMHNLKLLQSALTRLKIEKSIPIDRLVKGKLQDNLEFLQWFKKFYDMQNGFKENTNLLKKSVNGNEGSNYLRTGSNKNLTKANGKHGSETNLSVMKPVASNIELEAKRKALQEEYDDLMKKGKIIEADSYKYYEKLTKIEACINDFGGTETKNSWAKKVLEVLYREDLSPMTSD